jgi:hypothetical protein
MATQGIKVVIAGCRDFYDYPVVKSAIDHLEWSISEIVSGAATGVDTLGERYAKEYNLKLTKFKSQWDRYGIRAGPIRNVQMAQYADNLVAFWDGKSPGTKNMIAVMHRLTKPVVVVRIDPNKPNTLKGI